MLNIVLSMVDGDDNQENEDNSQVDAVGGIPKNKSRRRIRKRGPAVRVLLATEACPAVSSL